MGFGVVCWERLGRCLGDEFLDVDGTGFALDLDLLGGELLGAVAAVVLLFEAEW
jgi:hypothetical protein